MPNSDLVLKLVGWGCMTTTLDQYEKDYFKRMTGKHPGSAVSPASLQLLLKDLDEETCFEERVKTNLRDNLMRIIAESIAESPKEIS